MVEPRPTPDLSGRIYYEITAKCNLKCTHCNDSFVVEQSRLSADDLLGFHERISEGAVLHSVVTGGEPTLHKSFERIVSGLSSYGSVTVTSNGTVLSAERISRLLQAHPNVLYQVSVDAISEQRFDAIRGKGVHTKVLSHLNELSKMGVGSQVGISMTMMKPNLGDLEELVAYVRSRGFSTVHFPRLLHVGNAKHNWQDIELSVDDQISFEESLLKIGAGDESPLISSNIIDLVLARVMTDGFGDCLNHLTLKVNAAGEILPCPATGDCSLSIGSIRAFNSRAELLAALHNKSEEFLKRADWGGPQCQECHEKRVCGGRFCENCGILSSENINAENACAVFSHHFRTLEMEGVVSGRNIYCKD